MRRDRSSRRGRPRGRSLPHGPFSARRAVVKRGPAGEVGVVLDVGEAAVRADQRRQRAPLLVGVLDAEPAAGMQQPRGGDQQPADDVEPVGAAPERQRRVVVGDLARQPRAVGHVGRVGDDDVDACRRARGSSAGSVMSPGEHLDRACRPPRPGPAALCRVHSIAPGSRSTAVTRAPGCSCASDSAIAPEPVPRSTTIGRVEAGEPLQRPAGELLGLRARHEDARARPPARGTGRAPGR